VRILRRAGIFAAPVIVGLAAIVVPAGATTTASLPFLHSLQAATKVGSTIPSNGDVNPYGVAVVPTSVGKLVEGDILVSNFNSKANVQGTGSTIVEIAPSGSRQLFTHITALPAGSSCPGGIGLSTALSILPGGWVVVGSLPTGDQGKLPKTDPAGCLIVLNPAGNVVETFSNANIVGPWDMADVSTPSGADLFVSNALGGNTDTHKGYPVTGNCTVVRLDLSLSATKPPALTSSTVIGSGFPWKANAAALVLAPTGLALNLNGTLYVTNTLTNSVSAIPQAITRSSALAAGSSIITKNGSLNAPLGMTLAPTGDLLVVNGNNGVITEITPNGTQVAKKTLVKNGAGDLFGLAVTPNGEDLYFVNDGMNALDVATSARVVG
jgi:hypothetical protein